MRCVGVRKGDGIVECQTLYDIEKYESDCLRYEGATQCYLWFYLFFPALIAHNHSWLTFSEFLAWVKVGGDGKNEKCEI